MFRVHIMPVRNHHMRSKNCSISLQGNNLSHIIKIFFYSDNTMMRFFASDKETISFFNEETYIY